MYFQRKPNEISKKLKNEFGNSSDFYSNGTCLQNLLLNFMEPSESRPILTRRKMDL